MFNIQGVRIFANSLNISRITCATGTVILIYILLLQTSHLAESKVWAQDNQQREAELFDKQRREARFRFQPPTHGGGAKDGPYKKRLQEEANNEDTERPEQPVEAPTISSITMKSEFGTLGLTNLGICRKMYMDGCRIMPTALFVLPDANADEDTILITPLA